MIDKPNSPGDEPIKIGGSALDPDDPWAKTHLPGSADVVIIGGGIVGCSAAYFLAKLGVSVLLCEKGRIAGEQSGRNWGWVRKQGRSPKELPMMIDSCRIWSEWQRDGEDLGYTRGGCLYLADNDDDIKDYAEWMSTAHEHDLDTRLLDARELNTYLKNTGRRWPGALYTASDGRAEPHKAAPAIARSASRAGAEIRTRCAVRGVEQSAGQISAVVTEHGRVRTSQLLCAAGAWTSVFCRSLGIDVPQLRVKNTVARTAPAADIFSGTLWCEQIALRRRQDGGYTLAHGSVNQHAIVKDSFRYARKFLPALRRERHALRLGVDREFIASLFSACQWPLDRPGLFERTRVLDPPPDRRILSEIQQNARRNFPAIADAAIVESWAGIIETSPDVLPILSAVDALPGLFVAAGFSGHGFGLGPAAGRALAKLVTGTSPADELTAFRLSRFFDGSAVEPGPAL